MKASSKQSLAKNAKEIKQTGGGSALLEVTNTFDFSTKQIEGLTNKYDDDYTSHGQENSEMLGQDENHLNSMIIYAPVTPSLPPATPTTTPNIISLKRETKAGLLKQKYVLTELKETSIKLDNAMKEENLKKIVLENEKLLKENAMADDMMDLERALKQESLKKIGLESRKLELEVAILEKELQSFNKID